MKTILITGATAGFGKATAEIFAKHGHRLILTGRRQERLTEITQQFPNNTIHCLCFDIREAKAVEQAIDSLPKEFKQIDILINNAGLAAGLSTIQEGLLSDWEQMIDTNVKGLLYITRKVAPLMIAKNSGHIINIGSIAAKEVYPKGNVYCATKHAVDALSQSMRIDLLPHNIKVSAIHPGMAETEFSLVRFKGDEARAKQTYSGIKALTAEDIAETIYWLTTRPEHVNINDLVIMPTAQASTSVAIRQTI